MQVDCIFGVFYRRMKSCLGLAQATIATTRLNAREVYRMLKYQGKYEPLHVPECENRTLG
jgi:hypothetical protein